MLIRVVEYEGVDELGILPIAVFITLKLLSLLDGEELPRYGA